MSDCTEKFVIDHLPPVITVKLPDKKEDSLRIPVEIDAGTYVKERLKKAYVYELYAVIFQESNNYYAHCKAPSGQWNTYKNAEVSKISLEDVLRSDASTLYYKRSSKPQSKKIEELSKTEEIVFTALTILLIGYFIYYYFS